MHFGLTPQDLCHYWKCDLIDLIIQLFRSDPVDEPLYNRFLFSSFSKPTVHNDV